jgi:hypothetical protein
LQTIQQKSDSTKELKSRLYYKEAEIANRIERLNLYLILQKKITKSLINLVFSA